MFRNIGIYKSPLFYNTQIEPFQQVVQEQVQMKPDELAIVMESFQNVFNILVAQALERSQYVHGRIGNQLQTQVISLEPVRVHVHNDIIDA
jgi:hypothetical protein